VGSVFSLRPDVMSDYSILNVSRSSDHVVVR